LDILNFCFGPVEEGFFCWWWLEVIEGDHAVFFIRGFNAEPVAIGRFYKGEVFIDRDGDGDFFHIAQREKKCRSVVLSFCGMARTKDRADKVLLFFFGVSDTSSYVLSVAFS